MPNPYPIEFRRAAVRTYEAGEGSYAEIAENFSIGSRTLERWVARSRETGSLEPLPKRGGWKSPVDMDLLHEVVRLARDATIEDLTRLYNRRAPRKARTSTSGFGRALQRAGYVYKKNARVRVSKTARTSKRSAERFVDGRRR